MRIQEENIELQKKVHRRICEGHRFFSCAPYFLCHFLSFFSSTPSLVYSDFTYKNKCLLQKMVEGADPPLVSKSSLQLILLLFNFTSISLLCFKYFDQDCFSEKIFANSSSHSPLNFNILIFFITSKPFSKL